VKFPESWLRSFVDPEMPTQELARVLTMGGLDVESVEPVAPPFDKVVVGKSFRPRSTPTRTGSLFAGSISAATRPFQSCAGRPMSSSE